MYNIWIFGPAVAPCHLSSIDLAARLPSARHPPRSGAAVTDVARAAASWREVLLACRGRREDREEGGMRRQGGR